MDKKIRTYKHIVGEKKRQGEGQERNRKEGKKI
jgi:hypothetical protein